ncbi:MAG: transcriptional repressor [Treponema sp.]|nr:transcriptional repressor [Treponema sp.]
MIDRRQSKKRDALLELVRSSKVHPTAQWVHRRLKQQFPELSLGTVYRNIKVLLEEGVLASAGVVHGKEHFDGKIDPHPHAVCKRCGLILDLAVEEVSAHVPVTIPGFAVDARNTVFYGFCAKCKETTALGC